MIQFPPPQRCYFLRCLCGLFVDPPEPQIHIPHNLSHIGVDISETGCMLLIQDYVMVFLFSAAATVAPTVTLVHNAGLV